MCGIVQNRANLAATLKDARTVVGKLERFMAVVVQALFLFLYLMIWQVRVLDIHRQFESVREHMLQQGRGFIVLATMDKCSVS